MLLASAVPFMLNLAFAPHDSAANASIAQHVAATVDLELEDPCRFSIGTP